MESLEYRVPSGDLLGYECSLDLPVDHVSTTITFASRTGRWGFTSGRSGSFEALLADPDLGMGAVQYKVPWSLGLTWQVATYKEADGVYLAGLIGSGYDVTHTFVGSDLTRATMESYFSGFRFAETPEGITIEAPSDYSYTGELTVLCAVGGGVLDIPDGRSANGLLPKSAGADTKLGGEIWVESEDVDGLRLLVGYESAVAKCLVRGNEAEQQRTLDWLDNTRLSWTLAT